MSLKNLFLTHVPILPDDDFMTTFNKIAPHLVFDTTEKVYGFLFQNTGIDLCDDIVDLFDELDCDEQVSLEKLIDRTFEAVRDREQKIYNEMAGGLPGPRHAASQRALTKIMNNLNARMKPACACFAEGVLATRDRYVYEDALRREI